LLSGLAQSQSFERFTQRPIEILAQRRVYLFREIIEI
jgi:hypothetical protein